MPKTKDTSPRAMKDVGERIKEVREAAGLRQSDVAESLGRKQAWLQKIETGQRAVTLADFIAIAAALGKTLDELLPEKYFQKKRKNPVRTIDK